MLRKITPFLWFDGAAQEAAEFYVTIFKDARIVKASNISVEFVLEGQPFVALNGGPQYRFTPAVSFLIDCATQAEVDYYWDRLADGGEAGRCGWLKDRFGLSWQVVPSVLGTLLGSDDDAKAEAALQAMLGMNKLDVAALQSAYDSA